MRTYTTITFDTGNFGPAAANVYGIQFFHLIHLRRGSLFIYSYLQIPTLLSKKLVLSIDKHYSLINRNAPGHEGHNNHKTLPIQ